MKKSDFLNFSLYHATEHCLRSRKNQSLKHRKNAAPIQISLQNRKTDGLDPPSYRYHQTSLWLHKNYIHANRFLHNRSGQLKPL